MVIINMDKLKELQNGLQTAFIDTYYHSNLAYRPEFISNDYKKWKCQDRIHKSDYIGKFKKKGSL